MPESAITDAPPKGERENVLAELHPSERAWLVALAGAAGLTKNPSPARSLRILIRAAIANRDLLPVAVPLAGDPPPWLAECQDRSGRLAGWLAALPTDVLEELLTAAQRALEERREG